MPEHRADDNGAPSIHDQLAQLISLTRQNGEQLCECRSLTESRWEKMTAEIEEEQRQTQGLHDKLDEITSHRNEDLQQLEPSAEVSTSAVVRELRSVHEDVVNTMSTFREESRYSSLRHHEELAEILRDRGHD